MVKALVHGFFGLLVAGLLTGCGALPGNRPITAAGGVLDTAGWRFDGRDAIPLNGEWELYWNRLLAPEDFSRGRAPQKTGYHHFPGIWNGTRVGRVLLGGDGFATFRLSVLVADPARLYGIKIKEMGTAYNLWVDGVLVSSNGTVGTTRESMRPQFLPRVIFFTPRSNRVELVLQISNFYDKEGGMWAPVLFGSAAQIQREREWSFFIDVFLFGVIFIIGMYHVILYLLRRKEVTALSFGVFCLLIALHTFCFGERFVTWLMPGFNWELGMKLEYLSLSIALPVFMWFMDSLYHRERGASFRYALYLLSGLYTLLILATDAWVYTRCLLIFQILVATGCLYILILLVDASHKKQRGAFITTAGFMVLAVCIINDILNENQIIQTGYLLSFGLVCFIFAQAFLVAYRFSSAFSRSEHLAEALKASYQKIADYSLSLERKVEERTATITRQKEYLEEQVLMARRFQQELLPREIPRMRGATLAFRYVPMMGVGGDFIDFFGLDDRRIGLFICDVSGHGIVGALLASMVKMALNQWPSFLGEPAVILNAIRDSLLNKMGNHFVTAIAGYVDLDEGKMVLSGGGHPPALVVRSDGSIEIAERTGRLLSHGIEPFFPVSEIRIMPGDKIIFYTDGIIEAENGDGVNLGFDMFFQILQKHRALGPDALCNAVINEVVTFVGSDRFDDDLTILVMDCTG